MMPYTNMTADKDGVMRTTPNKLGAHKKITNEVIHTTINENLMLLYRMAINWNFMTYPQ